MSDLSNEGLTCYEVCSHPGRAANLLGRAVHTRVRRKATSFITESKVDHVLRPGQSIPCTLIVQFFATNPH